MSSVTVVASAAGVDGAVGEADWLLNPRWDEVPVATPAAFAQALGLTTRVGPSGPAESTGLSRHTDGGRLVLLAPHPDDETLGLGASLADLSDGGIELVVVLLTDGEASHPRCRHVSRDELVARRADEFNTAVGLLAPRAEIVRLGLPDGGLPDAADDLAAALEDLLQEGDLVLAPLPEDGHTDHDAAGAVAAQIVASKAVARAGDHSRVEATRAERRAPGIRLLHYPVWRWRRSDRDRFPFDRALLLTPSLAALHRKEQAIRAYTSQIGALTAFPGGEAVVGPVDLAPHRRLVETLIAPAETPDVFAPIADSTTTQECTAVARRLSAMFDAGVGDDDSDVAAGVSGDPWRTRSSWYEARKRALCLAALARPRYGRILDIGCSVGTLTAQLAARADEVAAIDGTPEALRHARTRYADLAQVRWIQGQVPDDLPPGPFDLVVLSEVGYFLTGAQLLGALRHARRALRPGGEILLCDWTHPTKDIPLDGMLVHRQAATALGLPRRVALIDQDFVVDVYGGPDTLAGL